MADSQRPPAYFFSIVVVGPMNPRLHHPQWYELIGAITEAERLEALGGEIVLIPMVGKFEVPSAGLTIVCQPDRWEIQTTSKDHQSRAASIADRVFAKLNETPVRAFGLNTHLHRPTTVSSVKARLAERLSNLNLGLPKEDNLACHLMVNAKEGDHKVRVEIAPSPLAENVVFVTYNTEYPPPVSGEMKYFNLGAALNERLGTHASRAEEAASKVVEGLIQ